MLARQIETLPRDTAGRRLLFEPKWDGFRALTIVDRHGAVGIYSRRGTALTRGFPEVVAAASTHLPTSTVLDGELVCWQGAGWISVGYSGGTTSPPKPRQHWL
jgi:ATP-dependent DNA ligase